MTTISGSRTRQRDWLVLAGILAGTFAVAALGSWLTMPSIHGWYAGLAKPSFNPPDSLFGPVWSALYFLMSMAVWLAWRSAPPVWRLRVLLIYIAQLALNLFWSILFFALHLPLLALIDCLALLAAIVWAISVFRQFSPTAGWLLMPYAIWVAFACLLNGAIIHLN
jgi:tryptophan-rich sensory protein